MADRAQLLSRLAAAVAAAPVTETLTARLALAVCRLLEADGASISVDTASPHRVTLHTTDEVAARIEHLHDDLGLGPGFEAFLTGQPVVLQVTAPTAKWSVFAEAAARLTPADMLIALPMRAGEVVLGVLTLYRSSPGGLTAALEDAAFVADALAAALLHDPGTVADLEDTGSWPDRAEIHQATGMVVAQLAIGVDDALALLRAHAFALDQTLGEVASAVVRRGIVFSTDADHD